MRFVIYSVFLTLWLGMWVWMYTCHIKTNCCPTGAVLSETTTMTKPDFNQFISFKWSEDEPIIDQGFVFYRDSIIALLEEDQILQITGWYYSDEKAAWDYEDLGMARAGQVLAIMAPQLDIDRFLLKSGLHDDLPLQDNMVFNAIDIQRVELKFTKSQ